jgi:hypothetical protein
MCPRSKKLAGGLWELLGGDVVFRERAFLGATFVRFPKVPVMSFCTLRVIVHCERSDDNSLLRTLT